jgi:hypothetical protein
MFFHSRHSPARSASVSNGCVIGSATARFRSSASAAASARAASTFVACSSCDLVEPPCSLQRPIDG